MGGVGNCAITVGLGVSQLGTRTPERKPQSWGQEGSAAIGLRPGVGFRDAERQLQGTMGAQGGDIAWHGPNSQELGVLVHSVLGPGQGGYSAQSQRCR